MQSYLIPISFCVGRGYLLKICILRVVQSPGAFPPFNFQDMQLSVFLNTCPISAKSYLPKLSKISKAIQAVIPLTSLFAIKPTWSSELRLGSSAPLFLPLGKSNWKKGCPRVYQAICFFYLSVFSPLNNSHLFPTVVESGKFKIQIPADSGPGDESLPRFAIAVLLCYHTVGEEKKLFVITS